MRSVFVCPVFNEVRTLPELLDRLRASDRAADEVLVVDNGSDDGSERLIAASGLRFVRLPRNRGLGQACIVGLDWALEHRFDLFGIIAGNGRMDPSEMGRLLDPLLAGTHDCVSGSRFLEGGRSPNLPGFRRRAIPWVNRWARLWSAASVSDATCGYRAFRTEPMRRAAFDWHAPWLHAYGFEFYVYAKFLLDPQLRCVEVPVTMRYPRTRRAYSKVPAITGWVSMMRPWAVARLDGRGFRPAGPEDAASAGRQP